MVASGSNRLEPDPICPVKKKFGVIRIRLGQDVRPALCKQLALFGGQGGIEGQRERLVIQPGGIREASVVQSSQPMNQLVDAAGGRGILVRTGLGRADEVIKRF